MVGLIMVKFLTTQTLLILKLGLYVEWVFKQPGLWSNLFYNPAFHVSTGEVSRLFSPYPQSSSLSSGMRRRQALIKPYTKKTYTHKFFCLSGRRDCKVPQLWEKMDLECSGLGEKKIVFPGTYTHALYGTILVLQVTW